MAENDVLTLGRRCLVLRGLLQEARDAIDYMDAALTNEFGGPAEFTELLSRIDAELGDA